MQVRHALGHWKINPLRSNQDDRALRESARNLGQNVRIYPRCQCPAEAKQRTWQTTQLFWHGPWRCGGGMEVLEIHSVRRKTTPRLPPVFLPFYPTLSPQHSILFHAH